ncbi:MAG TPA: histidine phosphatase family protein [Candidatus Faecousia intestinigallinarum]|nr:histidine phosphatase family protein [Candidatus Faecousia intestinigallinarum]
MTEIYLIRHAEAEGNIFRRLHGQYNSLLTPRGHQQVKCLEGRFENVRIDGCFASDLTRASLTARAIYVPKGLRLHRDKRFREVHVGAWEDLPYGYLDNFEEAGMWAFNHDPLHWGCDGSEPFDVYTQRFLEGMAAAAQEFDGGTVAIFGHGAVIRGTLMRLFFMNDLEKLPYSDNTGVSRLFYHNGRFTYDYLNDNSHIPEALSTFYIQKWWREKELRKESGLYFLPLESCCLPKELPRPESDSRGQIQAAMLCGRPVGVVSLGRPEGDTGVILGMSLLPELEGRYYGDQLLGCAFSFFRKQGCKQLRAVPGRYPDDILSRYEFAGESYKRSIDAECFDWGESYAP